MFEWQLSRDAFGRLVAENRDGARVHGVVPVRAFPFTAPGEGVALVSAEGREIAWIDRLSDLSGEFRALIEEELGRREFVPEILAIKEVSSFATPSTWSIDTDRGATKLVLRGEEDIRRLGAASLLIADSHGVQFLIRDLQTLDRISRRILDRFL